MLNSQLKSTVGKILAKAPMSSLYLQDHTLTPHTVKVWVFDPQVLPSVFDPQVLALSCHISLSEESEHRHSLGLNLRDLYISTRLVYTVFRGGMV